MPEEPEHPNRRSSDTELAVLTQSVQYLGAQLIGVEKSVDQTALHVERKLDNITDKLDSLRSEDLPRRIAKLENVWEWFVRLVVGAVILALLALVIRQGGA